MCPICNSKTRVKLRHDTVLNNFSLFCPKCKHETIINAKKLKISTITEPDTKT
ncbi:cysteine-rich KTR domain-containing protein [Tissierella praeacuta]|uniref:cysteine-rich KTR domain-containing protein n=1 Tax=Tissierella praeacuta TaxID=43131 RepID=UPI0033415996